MAFKKSKQNIPVTFTTTDCIQLPEILSRTWLEQNSLDTIEPTKTVHLDFRNTRNIDSSGIAVIVYLHRKFLHAGQRLVLSNVSSDIEQTLTRWNCDPPIYSGAKNDEHFFVRIGDSAITLYTNTISALSLLVEMLYWGSIGLIKKRDFRRGVFGEQMYQFGFKALGIVSLLSFLIGFVLSIQSQLQLRQFSAEIYLVAMITISMIREIGPIMTAVVLAGRTGSATTAEIATMKVQEEVDALTVMGINPIQFIVVPKVWAITLTMPLLTLFSIAVGIFSGFIVSTFIAHIPPTLFMQKLIETLMIRDMVIALCKSIVFSWLILWIGAYYGFRVHGGAEEVGKETTKSVVSAIFIIIVVDALFSFIY